MVATDIHSRRGGPVPKFRDYHIWKALWCLNQENPLGRKTLASKLGVGEGSTRTILAILQEEGLIMIRKSGVMLTPEGKSFWNNYDMDLAPFEDDSITIGKYNCAVRIPNAAFHVTNGCFERDAAIKAGAAGATTLVFTKGVLVFPDDSYGVSAKTQKLIRDLFTLHDGDAIIIGTADTEELAEEGAVSAALELNGGFLLRDEEPENVSSMSSNELIAFAFMVHDLVGGLPTCAKPRDGLGVRIENGRVIDNAYTGAVMEEVLEVGTTIRRIATSGPYKGIRVIVSPVELNNKVIASIGVVDIRSMAGINNPIRLHEDDDF